MVTTDTNSTFTDKADAPEGSLVTLGTRSPAVEAMHAKKWNIAGDVIQQAIKDLPDEQRAVIKWFAGYGRARNLGPQDCEQLIQKANGGFYSWASLYAVLTGRRQQQGVDITPLVEAIALFRRQVEPKTRLGDSGFIRTRLSEIMYERFDRARARRRVLFCWGDSQIGKTSVAVQYTVEHNHGETFYVEAPTGGGISAFMASLAAKLALPQEHRTGELRNRIIACFDQRMLLIVDEAHRFLHNGCGIHSLDLLRELYNRAGCGIVLLMTNEGRDLFLKGKHAVRLRQLWRRRIPPLQLPATVPPDDLALFADAYGLEPASDTPVTVRSPYTDENGREREKSFTAVPIELQTRVVTEEGLGVWLSILQDAADMAKAQKRAINWGAVLKAYCMMQADCEVLQ